MNIVPNKTTATLLVFFLTFSFYLYSLLPSLAWGDGVKLQSEAVSGESFVISEMTADEFKPDPYIFSKLGVAAWDHPLYTVIGHLLVRALPFVDPLWLVNFVSAFFGAASVTLVFLIAHRYTDSLLASIYAALSLAVSHTFWWHSSTPEVYTLFVFFLLSAFVLYEKYEESVGQAFSLTSSEIQMNGGFKTRSTLYLFFSAFFLGLATSTHILGFLAFPAIGLYYLLSGEYRQFNLREIKKLILPALGFTAGFSLYILQFIRLSANFPLNEIMGPVVGSAFFTQLEPLSLASIGRGGVRF